MLERLLPEHAASAETRQDQPDFELFPEELRSLGRPVEKRRREFVTGRACARLALERLGAPVVAVPNGGRGEPLWPGGVVGSITHCDGYRACAVAWSKEIAALGIDAEPNAPLPDGVLEEVASAGELDVAAAGEVHVDRLAFSAKEAIYKTWFPLTRRELGFHDVELSFGPASPGPPAGGDFSANLLVSGRVAGGSELTGLRGRWALEGGVVCTAVAVPAESLRIPNSGIP